MTFIFNKTKNLLGAYDLVAQWMIDFFALHEIEVQISETPQSYCPGKYDLVFNEKKFCGIAQIRTKKSVIVMLNLVLLGDQKKRLELMKQFYEIANPSMNPRYPQIELDSMAALNVFTVDQFKRLFTSYLKDTNRVISVLDKK